MMLGPMRSPASCAQYHHRPSRQGGSDDAQHRRHYPPARDALGQLHRPAVPACLHAQAPDVRWLVLLPPQSPGESDPLARPVPADAGPLPDGGRRVRQPTRAFPPCAFEPGQRKDDIVAGYRARFTSREGVVVIGTAQEKMRAFKAHKRRTPTGSVTLRLLPARRWRSNISISTSRIATGAPPF